MDLEAKNPYIILNGSLPPVKGLVNKIDRYDQNRGLKTVVGTFITFLSHLKSRLNNKEFVEDAYIKIMSGQELCVEQTNLIQAGLENSEYVKLVRQLIIKIREGNPVELQRIAKSPLFKAMDYFCDVQRWRGWERLPSAPVDSERPVNVALYCAICDPKEGCYFDIFSMLKDSLNGQGDDFTAVKACDDYIQHLKSLPSFRENYRPCSPKRDIRDFER